MKSRFYPKYHQGKGDRDLRVSMGIKAQEASQQWSWQQTVNNLVEIWSQEISKKNG